LGNKAHGTIWFTQASNGVKITAELHGLTPHAKHAFHVHEYGDATSTDGKSAGDHYNPQKMAHGRPEDENRHAGDFGNLPPADANGSVRYERIDKVISLVGIKNPVIGRSVVVHAGEDKFTGLSGDAGPRIGVGVIGIAQPRPTAQPVDAKQETGRK
jgi:superoxide dismutase, Cu-Zn family